MCKLRHQGSGSWTCRAAGSARRTQGELLAQVIRGVLDELDLSSDQRRRVPEVVRRHLTAAVS